MIKFLYLCLVRTSVNRLFANTLIIKGPDESGLHINYRQQRWFRKSRSELSAARNTFDSRYNFRRWSPAQAERAPILICRFPCLDKERRCWDQNPGASICTMTWSSNLDIFTRKLCDVDALEKILVCYVSIIVCCFPVVPQYIYFVSITFSHSRQMAVSKRFYGTEYRFMGLSEHLITFTITVFLVAFAWFHLTHLTNFLKNRRRKYVRNTFARSLATGMAAFSGEMAGSTASKNSVWSYSVMVSILDSESSDPSSILGKTKVLLIQ